MLNIKTVSKLLFVVFLLLQGCATTIEALDSSLGGYGVLSDERDAFNDVRRVRLSPAPVAKVAGESGIAWTSGLDVGAQWLDKQPNEVQLILQIDNDIAGINGIGVNVAGVIEKYNTIGLTNFDLNLDKKYTGPVSTAYAVMPLNRFQEMIASNDVVLRLFTLNGYVDADFSKRRGRGGALTAAHYLEKKFLPVLQ